jgi:hypothetical protein
MQSRYGTPSFSRRASRLDVLYSEDVPGLETFEIHKLFNAGTEIRLPSNPAHMPLADALRWHNEERFRG